MRRTASSPAVMSTPADAYVSLSSSWRSWRSWRSDTVRRRHVVALEDALAQRDGDLHRVVARHARVAEAGAGHADRGLQMLDGEIGKRVRAEIVADLADGHIRRDQLRAHARIH